MNIFLNRSYKLSLGIVLLAFLLASCSDMNPVTEPEEHTEVSMGTPHVPFDNLNLRLPEGYEVLRSSTALDDCDSMVISRYCRTLLPNVLSILDLTRLTVQGSDLPHNQTITMVMPNTCEAVVDLYPSPFQFDDEVELTWFLPQVRYGQLLNPRDLAAFYVHEDGTVELADFSWGPLNLWLTVETDHFSRYIIARRTQ
ncbi:MAG: hypothetical protein H6505_03245 [Calditrichaeota bacterium]|nr:hypothetical protein [Calditrichota bacterium]